MASGSFTLSNTGSTSAYITLVCSWSSQSGGSIANTSAVTVTVTASKSAGSTSDTWGSQTTEVLIDSIFRASSGSFRLSPGNTITLFSKTYTVYHNEDGTKSVTISATVGGNVMYGSGSTTVVLDTIPRYADVSQSLRSRTETTAAIKWTASAPADHIWYSTNNGISWTDGGTVEGMGGSYTITGLMADTNYNIITRVRRMDNGLTTDSAALSITTYAYPHADSMPDFIIGEKMTIGIYNPLRRQVVVSLIGANGNQIENVATTGTSISGYDGETTVDHLYASIPSAQSGTYTVKVTSDGGSLSKTGGTYTVDIAACAPIIENIAYMDTSDTAVAVTGDNQIIVQTHSLVQITASGIAAREHTSIQNCKVKVGGKEYGTELSGSTAVSVPFGMAQSGQQTIVVSVTDSRGITTNRPITIQVLEWRVPSAVITAQRQRNFYTETDILVDAEFASVDGHNGVAITYQATKEGDVQYSVSGVLHDGVPDTILLDNEFAWDAAIKIIDKFGGSTTYTVRIPRGMPIIFFDRIKSSVGINCFPAGEKTLEVNGINLERSVMTRSLNGDISDLISDSYTDIRFDTSVSSGSRLIASDDGGVEIGAGVRKVLASAMVTLQSGNAQGIRQVQIMKNGAGQGNVIARIIDTVPSGQTRTMVIPPVLANVSQGDIIHGMFSVPADTDKINGEGTSMTVEVVE